MGSVAVSATRGETEDAAAVGPVFEVLCLHPAIVEASVDASVVGRARRAGKVRVGVHDIRDEATDRHRTVDDTPYGGGPGMVLRVDVVARALAKVRRPDSLVLMTGPGGRTLDQAYAASLAERTHIVLVAGHYEGIDDRIRAHIDGEISIGDYVLTGGELAAAVVIDATLRLCAGVLGNADSAAEESFQHGLLEHPQYTRPLSFEGQEVPEVLRSGDHGRIAAWRLAAAQAKTRAQRPDLWERYCQTHQRDVGAPIAGVDPMPDPPASDRRRRRRQGAPASRDVDGPIENR